MKKFFLLVLFFLCFQGSFSYALKDCGGLEREYDTIRQQVVASIEVWGRIPSTDPKKVLYGKSLSDLISRGVEIENNYNECISTVKRVNSLIKNYFDIGNGYFRKSQWDMAIKQYKRIISLDPVSYHAYYNMGSAYLNKWSLEEALMYYEQAATLARGKAQIQESKNALENLKQEIEQEQKERISPSKDTFSHLQYYLRVLNIPEAWKKVKNSKEVIVAVIDDGINVNHPDLTDRIWVEEDASYGANKIRNFVGDEMPDNLPTGEHGTMVSGIIAARTDNEKWIAGIAKNAKIMPLRVFDFHWNAREDHIINAIYYAINKKAHIINLSLGQSQFAYSEKYDEVIKMAYDKGIVVIIAAGNGDVLSYKNSGVNTTVNPLSPVCNNGGDKPYSIGVESLDEKWTKARWSNYGSCVSFAAPGENIFSTSISVFNKEYGVDYDTESGTSFSAPMVAGIVALGYNQYGYVSPDTVYASLKESLRTNEAGNPVIDAARYIEILGEKKKPIEKEQADFAATGRNTAGKKQGTSSNTDKNASRITDAEYLALGGYIQKKNSAAAYKLSDFVLRQEVVALAMKISGTYIPQNYTCWNLFSDVSYNRPNTWACRIIENAYLEGIVVTQERDFRPEESVTLVEAVAILLRAGNIQIQSYNGGGFEPWQTDVIGTSFGIGLVEDDFDFSTTRKATRRDIFSIARKILQLGK